LLQVQLQNDATGFLFKQPDIHHYFCYREDVVLQGQGDIFVLISSFQLLFCLQPSMQVSKTFVAKTMKIIDKDDSGEVDVDEMV
jgi:hypothetical protein